MMRALSLRMGILCMLIASDSSAVNKSEMANCAAMIDDLERLNCYDNLAGRAELDGPQLGVPVIEGVGNWIVNEKVNPIDDSKTVTLILYASDGVSRWGEAIPFVARCQSSATEAYIRWGDYLGGEARVLTRVGSNKASTQRWTLSTDKQASFALQPIDLLKEMATADRFLAQVTPYNENPVTAIFLTSGLTNALKPLRETCDW